MHSFCNCCQGVSEQRIRWFSADGRPLRSYSRERLEFLAAHDRVVLIRNRKGRITSAHFREAGSSPIQAHAHMGQRYSFEQRVGDARLWQHKRLLHGARGAELADAERYLQAVFRAVPLSCMGKVVRIDSHPDYHRNQRRRRPIEFVSEGRK